MFTHLFTRFAADCRETFFGLVPWHRYLEKNNNCEPVNFEVLKQNGNSDFLLILLALVDNLLRIAALVAIGAVIYGGYLYISSQGSPDQTGKAQNTIQNALVGLVVAMLSVALVSYLGGRIG